MGGFFTDQAGKLSNVGTGCLFSALETFGYDRYESVLLKHIITQPSLNVRAPKVGSIPQAHNMSK